MKKNRQKIERNLDEKSKLCLKCRYCCEYVNLPLREGYGYAEFYQNVRGMELKFLGFIPWMIIHSPCQHLTDNGCAIYKARPDACKAYDGRRDLFHPEKCLWNTIKEGDK